MAHRHYYPRGGEPQSTLLDPRLVYTGTVGDDPEWFNIPHSHSFCELLYVVGGRGHALVGDSQCALTAGDLVVIGPGVMHEERSDPADPLSIAFCGVDGFQVQGLPPCTLLLEGDYPVLRPDGNYRARLEGCFLELIGETAGQVRYCAEMSRSLVGMLLVLVLRLQLSREDAAVKKKGLSEECRRVADFINSNYSSSLSLADLSQTVYISKHHLAHLFKSQTGVSPIRYLINKRIEEARLLLRETDLPIGDVAQRVGYSDPVYFSQLFRKSTGCSPSDFRVQSHPD